MRHLALALLVAGCGGGTNNGSPDMSRADGGVVMETCTTDNNPVKLEALYGVRGTLNVNVKVTSDCTDSCIFDGDAKAQILLLADVTQTGQTSTVTARPCKIDIPPVALKGQPMPTVLSAPDSLVQSVKPVTSAATLGGSTTCASYASMPIPIVLGAKLADPAGDPLPVFTKAVPPVKLCNGMAGTTCDAATESGCVCDQESDGKSGATVNASGTPVFDDIDEVYLALRTVVSLNGQVYPPSVGQATPGQRLKGTIAGLKLEQSPVGCHRTPTGGGAPIDCDDNTTNSLVGFNPLVTQSPNAQSTFVGMPVPAGYTCTDLINNAATLFKGQ